MAKEQRKQEETQQDFNVRIPISFESDGAKRQRLCSVVVAWSNIQRVKDSMTILSTVFSLSAFNLEPFCTCLATEVTWLSPSTVGFGTALTVIGRERALWTARIG
ncbi:predicted protein [Lichtheimia corymbifera JMRC:FSU:9682]|uniref:Uncharacterized protein n=1 Tax=Lichtheimia corymbifera JMRC:FSU:9682 TaxID=1263082 RepID=A0A068SDJ0_9FUNG|nr:predicted protein [Lichtheimia corymbifera JMRC:FSU:9682]